MILLYLVFSATLLLYAVHTTLLYYAVAIFIALLLVIALGRDALTILYLGGLLATGLSSILGDPLLSSASIMVSVVAPIAYAEMRIISLRDTILSLRDPREPALTIIELGKRYLFASLVLLLLDAAISPRTLHASTLQPLLSVLAAIPYALVAQALSRGWRGNFLLVLALLALPITLSSIILLLRVMGGKHALDLLLLTYRENCVNIGRIDSVIAPFSENPLNEPMAGRRKQQGLELYRAQGIDYCIPLDVTKPTHVLILGASGTGKSHLLALIARRITASYPDTGIIMLDVHGEYREQLASTHDFKIIDASTQTLDIFDPLDEEPELHIERILDYYKLIAPLGPLQEQLLREILADLYSTHVKPDFKTLASQLAIIARNDQRAVALLNYTRLLESILGNKPLIDHRRLLENRVVVDLSRLPTDWAKQVYVDTLMRLVFAQLARKGITDKPRLILVVDEAHLFTNGVRLRPMLIKAVTEMRKYGLIVIAATQYPSQLDTAVVANTAFKILLPLYDPAEARHAAKLLGITGAETLITSILMHMGQGRAMVSDRDLKTPLIIAIE